jgi:ssDNA-binding Zn-finger/Zn-ribbon topoisomerase 1
MIIRRININVKEGDNCPWCKAGFVRRIDGRFGPFYACTRYPYCYFIAKILSPEEIKRAELKKQADEILSKNHYGL